VLLSKLADAPILIAIAWGALASGCGGSDHGPATDRGATSPATGRVGIGSTPVRGCDQRIEGGPLPRRPGDKVIGGVNFLNLPPSWADAQANEARDGPGYQPPPGLRAAPMKEAVTVPAGMTVTVIVPRRERRWFALMFDTSAPHALERPESAITFKACRRTKSRAQLLRECGHLGGNACRWGYTEFNGGIYVDFDRAPQRGRCARLYVQRAGNSKPIVGYPFVDDPATCRR
jgi:hypothetical protein